MISAPIAEQKEKLDSGYYMPKKGEYHVTSLLGCPRKAVMGRIFGEFSQPVNLWKMQMGTLGHELMERHPAGNGLAERLLKFNFHIPVNGEDRQCTVVGKFDWYGFDDRLIHDYKFPWTLDYVPNDKHFQQMAAYYIIGTRSGAFDIGEIRGCQIDYVYIRDASMYSYKLTGDAFKERIRFMSTYLVDMLNHYLQAEINGILPKGDPARKECAYCSPDFKAHCAEGGNARACPDDVRTVKISVDAYRRNNTPPDNR
jgi:hypothetical protein